MFAALIIFVIMAALYATLYYFNSKTLPPKGVKLASEGCMSCTISSCDVHPTKVLKEAL